MHFCSYCQEVFLFCWHHQDSSEFSIHNDVVCIVSFFILIFNPSGLFSKTLGTVPNAPTKIITNTFMFHMSLSSLVRYRYLFIFPSFIFTLCATVIVNRWIIFFFVLINPRTGFLTGIIGSVCISKSKRILCVSFSSKKFGLSTYYLLVMSNLNLLHQMNHLSHPVMPSLILFFCIVHSLIKWLTVYLNLHITNTYFSVAFYQISL